MTDDKPLTTLTPPVTLNVIGTSDGLVDGTTAKTPADQPNVLIKITSPIIALAIRFGNEYCVSLAGALMAGGLTVKIMPHTDSLQLLSLSAFLALCTAGIGLLKNSATMLGGLEKKFPLGSGSI